MYKEEHKVSNADNLWLQYYDEQFCNNKNTRQEDDKQCYLGNNYSNDSNWYYQWNRNEKYYYVVVD